MPTIDKKHTKDEMTLKDSQKLSNEERPWGGFKILDEGHNYKVKKLYVKPGKRLSLQKHHHRCEHWTVIQGTAKVRIDDKETILSVNESTYIEKNQLHRLENIGQDLLYIIETQCGEYLGEDDIIRYEDDFNRNK
jgi:mannose-6-phosphate isomerase-like protein (cupin superfamily)